MSRTGLLKRDHQVTQIITVKKRPDILRVTTVKKLSLFWYNIGSITATCDLPRTGFSPGESIPHTIYVRNETFTSKCALLREDEFFASTGQHRIIRTKISKLISPVIRAGDIQSIRGDLAIPIEAFATLRLQDCSCISVKYDFIITVKIPWSINRKMKIPIMIAHRPPMQFGMQPQHALSHVHDDFPLHSDYSNMTQGERTDPSLPTYSEACQAGAGASYS